MLPYSIILLIVRVKALKSSAAVCVECVCEGHGRSRPAARLPVMIGSRSLRLWLPMILPCCGFLKAIPHWKSWRPRVSLCGRAAAVFPARMIAFSVPAVKKLAFGQGQGTNTTTPPKPFFEHLLPLPPVCVHSCSLFSFSLPFSLSPLSYPSLILPLSETRKTDVPFYFPKQISSKWSPFDFFFFTSWRSFQGNRFLLWLVFCQGLIGLLGTESTKTQEL